jgi:hypothetical protein
MGKYSITTFLMGIHPITYFFSTDKWKVFHSEILTRAKGVSGKTQSSTGVFG